MASRQKILVDLRFRHPSISASELIERVGLEPAVAYEKGTRRSTVGGKVRTNPQVYCSFPIRVASLKFPSKALKRGIAILERALPARPKFTKNCYCVVKDQFLDRAFQRSADELAQTETEPRP